MSVLNSNLLLTLKSTKTLKILETLNITADEVVV